MRALFYVLAFFFIFFSPKSSKILLAQNLKMDACQLTVMKELGVDLTKSFAPQGLIGYLPRVNSETSEKMELIGGFAWSTGPGFLLVRNIEEARRLDRSTYMAKEYQTDANNQREEVSVVRRGLNDVMYRISYIIPEHSYDEFNAAFRNLKKELKLEDPYVAYEDAKLFFDWARKTNAKLVWFETKYPSRDVNEYAGKETDDDYDEKSVLFSDLEDRFDLTKLFIAPSETSLYKQSATYNYIYDQQRSVLFKNPVSTLWSFPVFHALFWYPDWKNSHAMKRIMKEARRLYRQGYKVIFNPQDPKMQEAIVERFASQHRKGMKVQHNRYAVDLTKNLLREKLQSGFYFSVVLLDPDGKMVAGQTGPIVKGKVSSVSIFYDSPYDEEGNLIEEPQLLDTDSEEERQKKAKEGERIRFIRKHGILFTKITDMALAYVLQSQGINFLDVGMVTPLTQIMKGYYVRREEFYELWSKVADKDEVTFPQVWDAETQNPLSF